LGIDIVRESARRAKQTDLSLDTGSQAAVSNLERELEMAKNENSSLKDVAQSFDLERMAFFQENQS
jgi:hypothetical protein